MEINLTQRCFVEILRMIRNKELQPSQKIGETRIAERLKVGRAPVRIALDRLAQAGVVERIARSGTFIKEISVKEFCEIMDIRASLEGLAIRLSCSRVSDEEIQKLSEIAEEVDRLSINRFSKNADLSSILEKDLQFHQTIAELSGNNRLIDILKNQRLLEHSFLASVRGMFSPSKEQINSIPKHSDIVNVLRSRNKTEAETVIRKHILLTKEINSSAVLGESHY